MLVVATFELGNPMLLAIEMEADDALIHGDWKTASGVYPALRPGSPRARCSGCRDMKTLFGSSR